MTFHIYGEYDVPLYAWNSLDEARSALSLARTVEADAFLVWSNADAEAQDEGEGDDTARFWGVFGGPDGLWVFAPDETGLTFDDEMSAPAGFGWYCIG